MNDITVFFIYKYTVQNNLNKSNSMISIHWKKLFDTWSLKWQRSEYNILMSLTSKRDVTHCELKLKAIGFPRLTTSYSKFLQENIILQHIEL